MYKTFGVFLLVCAVMIPMSVFAAYDEIFSYIDTSISAGGSGSVDLNSYGVSNLTIQVVANAYGASQCGCNGGTFGGSSLATIESFSNSYNLSGSDPMTVNSSLEGLFVRDGLGNWTVSGTDIGTNVPVPAVVFISASAVVGGNDAVGTAQVGGYVYYTPPTVGTINVSSNNPAAAWTITGPAVLPGSGLSQSYNNQPTGVYTINWAPDAGFITPASATQTLLSGGTLNFPMGNYQPAFQITASVNNGAYGNINPNGVVDVASGGSQAFTTTINPTRRLAWYHIDGNTHVAPTNNPYTFNNVLSNRSIMSVIWPYQNLGGISTPTGVSVTSQACGGIQFSWNPVPAATAGYMVFEGVPTDPIMMSASGPYMTNTYIRTVGLVPGNTYCFSVEASNSFDSVPSVPVCAVAPPACAAPTINLNFSQE